MKPLLSLRARLLLGAILWTVGAVRAALLVSTMILLRHPGYPRVLHGTAAFHGTELTIVGDRADDRRPLAGALRPVAVQSASRPVVRGARRTRSPGRRRVSERSAAARRRPQRAARAPRADGDPRDRQGRRSRARTEDAAGRARPGSRARRGRGAAGPRRRDRPAGRAHAAADRLPPRARAGGRIGRDVGRPLRRSRRRPKGCRARCCGCTPDEASRSKRGSTRCTPSSASARISTRCSATSSTTRASGRARASTITSTPGDGVVAIAVDDDGPGWRRRCAMRCCSAACAPTRRRRARGSGLAIVRDLAELYGGSIALGQSPLGGSARDAGDCRGPNGMAKGKGRRANGRQPSLLAAPPCRRCLRHPRHRRVRDGYFRDELYYLACTRRMAWGYVDHPPLCVALSLGRAAPRRRVARASCVLSPPWPPPRSCG